MHRLAVIATISALSAGAGFTPGVLGQPSRNNAEVPGLDVPMENIERALVDNRISDDEILELNQLLPGNYRDGGDEQTPSLDLHIAPIDIDGLDNAMYFELHRTDDLANPFRQGVIHLYRNRGNLRLRFFDFAGGASFGGAVASLWAAPDLFPVLSVSDLTPNLEVALNRSAKGEFRGQSPHPFLTMRDGAVEMTSTVRISEGEFEIADSGFDAEGVRVWGSSTGFSFTRVDMSLPVDRRENGLVILELTQGEGAGLESGGDVAVQYTGWTRVGKKFDSSRDEGRDAFRLRIPGRAIAGWNEGVLGIKNGERRRLIIPPELAYGPRGVPQVGILPNATLVFEVECVWLQNPTERPPMPGEPAGPADSSR